MPKGETRADFADWSFALALEYPFGPQGKDGGDHTLTRPVKRPAIYRSVPRRRKGEKTLARGGSQSTDLQKIIRQAR